MTRQLSGARPGIAALRRRLVIEQPLDSTDDAGGATRTWALVATVWGAIERLAAETRLEADRPAQAITHRITLRWRGDLDAGKRLRLGARVFVVHAVADADDHRRSLAVLAEEIAP